MNKQQQAVFSATIQTEESLSCPDVMMPLLLMVGFHSSLYALSLVLSKKKLEVKLCVKLLPEDYLHSVPVTCIHSSPSRMHQLPAGRVVFLPFRLEVEHKIKGLF